MTYEEAKRRLLNDCDTCRDYANDARKCLRRDSDCFECKHTLWEALNKQIPKKPRQVNKCTYWVCDNCGGDVGDSKTHLNYCGCCGQLQDFTKIKYWSKEK